MIPRGTGFKEYRERVLNLDREEKEPLVFSFNDGDLVPAAG